MTQFTFITPSSVTGKFFRLTTTFSHAASAHVLPILSHEFSAVATEYPLAFVPQNDQFVLVMVCSYRANTNFYVAPDGQWIGSYVPFSIRHPAFRLGQINQDNTNTQNTALCVDLTHESIGSKEDKGFNSFFDADNKPNPLILSILNELNLQQASRQITSDAVLHLDSLGLIEPWPITVQNEQKTEQTISGLYRISESALMALSDGDWLKLRRYNAIALAHAQLISMRNLQSLGKAAHIQSQLQKKVQKPITTDHLLAGDTLTFN